MARTDTLGNFLTDVADAIREKTGSEETIQASEFDTAISEIPSGADLNEYYEIENPSTSSGQFISAQLGAWYRNIKKLPEFNAPSDTSRFFAGYSGTNVDNVLKNWPANAIPRYGLSNMFYGCTYLTSIDMSHFVVDVSNLLSAFYNCSSLMFLDIRNMTLTSVSQTTNAFNNVPSNCLIIVKDQAQKTWMNSNFSTLTNVKTAEEYEESLNS